MRGCVISRIVGIGVFAVVLIGAAPVAAQSVKVVSSTVPIPVEGETEELPGVRYGYPFTSELTSISYKVEDEDAGGKIKIHWHLTGESSRARPQRVKISVFLVDGQGKQIDATRKNIIMKSNEPNQTFDFTMKTTDSVWDEAEMVRVTAHFLIGA